MYWKYLWHHGIFRSLPQLFGSWRIVPFFAPRPLTWLFWDVNVIILTTKNCNFRSSQLLELHDRRSLLNSSGVNIIILWLLTLDLRKAQKLCYYCTITALFLPWLLHETHAIVFVKQPKNNFKTCFSLFVNITRDMKKLKFVFPI